MDLLTLLIIGHISIAICIAWSQLPPLWACYTEGRLRNFTASMLTVLIMGLIPVYNVYRYLTYDVSYFYHAPYHDDEEDSE